MSDFKPTGGRRAEEVHDAPSFKATSLESSQLLSCIAHRVNLPIWTWIAREKSGENCCG